MQNFLKLFHDIWPKKQHDHSFYICIPPFQLEPHGGSARGQGRSAAQPSHRSGSVLGQSVLVVRAGKCPVIHLLQPVRLIFRHNLSEVTQQNPSNWQNNPLPAVRLFTFLTMCYRRRRGLVFFGRIYS